MKTAVPILLGPFTNSTRWPGLLVPAKHPLMHYPISVCIKHDCIYWKSYATEQKFSKNNMNDNHNFKREYCKTKQKTKPSCSMMPPSYMKSQCFHNMMFFGWHKVFLEVLSVCTESTDKFTSLERLGRANCILLEFCNKNC